MNISRTDTLRLVKYLTDAALLYDEHRGQKYVCRAHMLRQMASKLINRMTKQ